MERRNLRVIFNKSGSGSVTTRVTLPKTWMDKLGVKEWDKIVDVSFDGDKIVIEKAKINDENTIVGKKWGELEEKERQALFKNANTIDARTCDTLKDDGECIIDLTEFYSVPGKLIDGKIHINDNAVIYDSRG